MNLNSGCIVDLFFRTVDVFRALILPRHFDNFMQAAEPTRLHEPVNLDCSINCR